MTNSIGLSVHPWYLCGNWERLAEELYGIELAGANTCELILHGLDVVVGGKIIPERMRTLRRLLADHELVYTLHLPYDLNLLDQEAGVLYQDVFRAGIEVAETIDCPVIVYHAGITKKACVDPAILEAEKLRPFMADISRCTLCMENSWTYAVGERSCGQTSQAMLHMAQIMHHPNFALTLDIGHSFVAHRGDAQQLLKDIQLLMPAIGHVHLHDNCGINLAMAEQDYNHRIACGAADLHLPLFWGRIPIADVLAALSYYTGIINLETELRFRAQYAKDIAYLHAFGAPDQPRSCGNNSGSY